MLIGTPVQERWSLYPVDGKHKWISIQVIGRSKKLENNAM
jgi:hypothetical protein